MAGRRTSRKLPAVVVLVIAVVSWFLKSNGLPTNLRELVDQYVPQTVSEGDAGGMLVERVVDGDTLVLANGDRVRLIGVDTPETKHPTKGVEPFGPEASEFTKRAVEGKTVSLKFDREKYDRYQRLLAYVYFGDRCLNEEIIRAGLSECVTKYPFDKSMRHRFQVAEDEARTNRRGLWSGASRVAMQ